ncbi:MAG: flippase [Cetobacterium sp.]|uniref:flippase n=1 Tax=Cetobacterium sp. TaxID=2071632 RepID=UPI003F363EB1
MKNRILENIGWLVMDRFLMLFLQFFVGIKVANYYGSETYGVYSYALAIIGFSPIILEVMNGRVIKEYYGEDFNRVVSVVSTFKKIASLGILLVVIVLGYFIGGSREFYYLLVLLALENVIISATGGIENYFEFKLLSKNMVVANNIVKFLSYGLQYGGILLGYSIMIIPGIRIVTGIIRWIILERFYIKTFGVRVKNILDLSLMKKIIGESYYLWISFIAFIVYTQVDRVMIGSILGDREVGVYTIAVQLSSILAILITPFQNSVYPKLMELFRRDYGEYRKKYLQMNCIFTQMYLVITVISMVVVKYAFPYIYSKEYSGAVVCYFILCISIFFKANGALQTGHMTLKKITKKSFYKTLGGLFINMGLNLYLIPRYGIYGAAWATGITQIFTMFLFDLFIREYREQFVIQLKSFNPFNMVI